MKKSIIALTLIFVYMFIAYGTIKPNITVVAEEDTSGEYAPLNSSLQEYISYEEYLETHKDYNLVDAQIPIDIFSYETFNQQVENETDGIVTSERGSVTWTFTVNTSGFYNLRVVYYPVEGKSSSIERRLYLDGVVPFQGADQLIFTRVWVDSEQGITINNNNEVRPDQVEAPEWRTVYASDSQKYVEGPYRFFLEAGEHTLTFESIREPMKIGALVFEKAKEIKPYAEIIAGLKTQYPIYTGKTIKLQAERLDMQDKGNQVLAIKKSSPTLYPISDYSSPRTEPYHPYNIVLNTIGGYSWRVVGDWIEWDFEAPKEGLYQISFRLRQNQNRGAFSARELRVNGEIPFKEAYSIAVTYDADFKMYTLGDKSGPYLFYLKEGKNTISLEVTTGQMGPIIKEVEDSTRILNDLYRQIVQLTGINPDKYIDYELRKKLPHMETTFKDEGDRLTRIVEQIKAIAKEKSEKTAIIEKMAVQLKDLAKNPEGIVNRVNVFKSNISALSTWILSANEQPLEIDYILVGSPGMRLPNPKTNIFEKIYFGILRFIATFLVDNTNLSSDGSGDETVEVWIQSGRDQAMIIRSLIDNTFTPQHKINIDLKLIPDGVVLPATLAGEGPDVVLAVNGNMTVNFAMRNAAQDLTIFPDFEDVAKDFHPSAFVPLTYQGGIFGLPETQSFLMLFYRKDILSQMGLEVPRTWEDVEKMIPVMQINNYEFYLPASVSMYATLLYQMGGTLYLGEGNDLGIESGLASEEAMQAFKTWTDFYTSYKFPISADFANRFRTGEMPIGIADYTLYNTLSVFAPEIRGLWGFAPLPGIERDGLLHNESVSGVGNTLMLKAAKNKEAAWEFMKWWASSPTQVAYGRALEGILGAAARYPAANLDALSKLPWPSEHYDALINQFNNVVCLPEVPGGYLTGREINYALLAVVNDGINPREALYEHKKIIDVELTIKRKEFNLSTKE